MSEEAATVHHSRQKRSAFAELMAPKSKQSKPSTMAEDARSMLSKFDRRGGLSEYISDPESNPGGLVIHHNANFVLIRDMYLKATVHLLLLPRDSTKNLLHPHEALADQDFLNAIREEVMNAKKVAAKELRRQLSKFSVSDQPRNEAMDSPDPPENLPDGRDWEQEIKVGVHAHPSMAHLHIHIISRDMHSPSLKTRKHYNSFNTDFFIPLEDYPLGEDDVRRGTRYQNETLLTKDFVCWRCGRNFGNKFKALKEHLETEFEAWKRD